VQQRNTDRPELFVRICSSHSDDDDDDDNDDETHMSTKTYRFTTNETGSKTGSGFN